MLNARSPNLSRERVTGILLLVADRSADLLTSLAGACTVCVCACVVRNAGGDSAETVGQFLEAAERGAEPLLLPPDGSECGTGEVLGQRPSPCRRLPLPAYTACHLQPFLLRLAAKDTRHYGDGTCRCLFNFSFYF